MASVCKDVLDACLNESLISAQQLEEAEKALLDRYKSTFDFCILRTLTSIQVWPFVNFLRVNNIPNAINELLKFTGHLYRKQTKG